ncbi:MULTISPECIES: SusC/RagA family TonB-linked outer membrane protein [Flavobacteriaceae]|uniref:TonB-dependent receptor n=2 Tax=Flavobacteriaceae TaxID=49546 RepID=A0A4Y8AVW5_9FLAO|nr:MULTISPECIES: TonB-dependent receptor [Flavobacteriaceae]TEW75522.1 TonB-dependent receptor [Gramella jeungdoensis]GGK45928.1 SusC/RagA family TonB-linked outer membrane protein [Lutibacter litoralis]
MKKQQSKNQNKSFSGLFLLLFVFVTFGFTSNSFSQSIKVNGTITDTKGIPFPGATVTIKSNQSIGVQSDFDGNYSIEVPNEQTVLVYSYLGFLTKEITVGNQKTINVTLQESAESLDEVVVIGYGTQKKSDVTGAIGQVKASELTQVVTSDPMSALQGRVSGVTVTSSSGSPGSASDIMIRGIGSFGNNQPLYIIDGVQADPSFMDSNNIASIEVLKDAASGAIYGTRAANGVVIVTTKTGKLGKPRIDIESSYSSNTSRNEMDLLDAQGYVKVHGQMFENAGGTLPLYVQNPPAVNTDWIDETHRSGQLSLLNVRVSGATDNINYSVSGNFADEIGLLIGSDYTKKGISANLGIKKGKLKINTNLNYTETNKETYKFSLRETYNISPLIPVYDNTKEYGFGFRDGDLPDHRNPVGDAAFLQGNTNLKYFLGNITFGYEIIEGLNVKANFSMSNLANYNYSFHTPFQVRDVTEESDEYAFVSEYNNEFRRLNQEYTANYKFELNKNSFDVLVGYQRVSEPFKETYAQGEGYKLDEDGNKVPAIILDDSFNTLNAFADGTYAASGTNAEYSLVSYFGRINYSYDEKYLFQASVRRDGSSKFGKNNRYGVFPSFALGWKITDEKFMENQTIFDFLKLRTSWGQAGNDSALGYYDYVALISQGKSQNDGGYVFGNPQTSSLGSIARDLQNDDLQWETNISSNYGLDFALLDRKLSGAMNYYKSSTEDLLITKVVSPSAGINSPVVNVGAFENKGFEFELGYKNNDNEFHYNAFATFTTINSEVTKLSSEDQVLYGVGLKYGSDHFVNQTKVGHEPGAFFLPTADGIFQNQTEIDAHSLNGELIQPEAAPGDIRFVDQNNDGIINNDDATYQGTAIPKYEYSLSLNSDYKGFDFNLFFQGVGGNKIYNGNDFEMLGMDSGRNFKTETLNAWTPTNTNTDIPRAVLGDPNQNTRASTRFLEDGGYFRIKTIQLGYSINKETLESLQVSKCRVYLTGQNLFTFTNYSGLDPEVGGSILSRGIDRSLYPKYKSVILGVQLQF